MSENQDSEYAGATIRIAELEAALVQKTALLGEIDHRVKNNLQLISSLMLLQSRRITDETARHALKSMLERVTAVATVHRRLFQGADPQRFDVTEFVRDLVGDLAMAAGRNDITITLDLQPASIPSSHAAPFALIANELVGNALKHAFPPGRPGRISVGLTAEDQTCVFTVTDDGAGRGDAPGGFGRTIVELMSRQLHAELTTKDGPTGLSVSVRIPPKAG